MGKGYLRIDVLGRADGDLRALESALRDATIVLENHLAPHPVTMLSNRGDDVSGTREEFMSRLCASEPFGVQFWRTEGIDLFCTVVPLVGRYSLLFHFDGAISVYLQQV
jgi:hypothetical protein